MRKKIFSIGVTIPGGDVERIPWHSNKSLLDADIIVVEPSLGNFSSFESYRGKPLLSESSSFSVVERINRWRAELQLAFDAGKTIFIFLPKLQEVYVYTGEKQHSGTGRSRATTNIVASFDNYRAIPFELGPVVPREGTEIRKVGDPEFLTSYWDQFGKDSAYEVYFTRQSKGTILSTTAENTTVGMVIRDQNGIMVLLPSIKTKPKSGESKQFGKKLVSALIEMEKALREASRITPTPDWANKSEYRMELEAKLEQRIREVTKKIEGGQLERRTLMLQLSQEGSLRRLLYESGAQLEQGIIQALTIMGFEAKPYSDADSEFDVIFVSPEGRCLGEAEGTNGRAINIKKLSQLERNLQEDFAKEGVTEYAKGVLFGNAFRLMPPSERPGFFTEKCERGAQRSQVALVRTTDLFEIAKHLRDNENPEFAKMCREQIFQTEGEVVVFPSVPSKSKLEEKRILKPDEKSQTTVA